MSVVEEIKQKLDIVDIIGQYTKLTKSGKAMRGLCPFHSEKHGSFFVYPDQQSWHCFGACGTGGDIFSFVMKRENCDFTEAKKMLAERAGVALVPETPIARQQKEKHERLYQASEAAVAYYHQLLLTSSEAEKVRQYLGRRGVNAESVERFQLGYSPNAFDALRQHLLERGFTDEELLEGGLIIESEGKHRHDRFRHRLMFPIWDGRGRPIAFGARALEAEAQPKYLNSPATPLFDKSETFYGLHLAREALRREDRAVLVEGYMDVLIAHQYGFQNVLAAMGTAITDTHAQTLKKLTRNLVLALDPDAAGAEATLRQIGLENVLEAEICVALLPAGRDPDEIIIQDAEEWRALIQAAIPILDYAFEQVAVGLDLRSARGRAALVERLLPLVAQLKDAVRRGYYLNKLAELAKVDAKELTLALAQRRKPVAPKANAPQADAVRVASNPKEDYFLAILLRYPALRAEGRQLPPECFESTENREIFNLLYNIAETADIKESLDSSLWEHYDALLQRELLDVDIESKLTQIILRLRKDYLQRLAQRRADSLASEESAALRELFVAEDKLGLEKRKR